MYSLRRTRDGAGDSGPLSRAFKLVDGKITTVGSRPEVGAGMQVGSLTARTYGHQDWWATTPITEILEETDTYVRFKTGNSEYEWRNNG